MEDLILSYLNMASRQNPVTRSFLINVLGLNDREVRRLINKLRCDGYRICSSSGKAGYWLAKDQADYDAFRKDYTTAPMKLFEAVRAMDANLPGQIKMSEINAGKQMKTDNHNISHEEVFVNGR